MMTDKNVPYEKWSRADFRRAYEEADELLKESVAERNALRADIKGANEKITQAAVDIADLKKRLHAAETSNQFMRGYLSRVQEDDTVREELVTIGEPGGEQQMVPKRKPTTFERPSDFTEPQDRQSGLYHEYGRERRPARHWITY